MKMKEKENLLIVLFKQAHKLVKSSKHKRQFNRKTQEKDLIYPQQKKKMKITMKTKNKMVLQKC